MAVEGVRVSLLITEAGRVSRGSRAVGRLKDTAHIVWTLFNKTYVERRSKASGPVDMSADLVGAETINCRVKPVGKYGQAFEDEDLARIRDHELDLILRFGFGILKGEILEVPSHGVWSFHHGDERAYRGRPPGFWEMFDGEAVMGSVLQRLTERLDAGVVLHRGFFGVTPHSYVRTRDEALLGSAEWPSIVARQLMMGNTRGLHAAPSHTEAKIRHDPSNIVTIMFLARQALAFMRAQWRGLTRASKWTIGVAREPIAGFLDGETPEISWLPEAVGGRYLADPFGHREDGRLWALVEEYDYTSRRGVISALDTETGISGVVLDTGVHASYPYLFEHDGALFCVPETYQAGEVRIYRCAAFPHEWDHVGTPVSGMAALDPTVFHHDGRWWLMCTDQLSGPNTKLHVFHATGLDAPWQPHALNPVKTDIRSSRPAGTPFVIEGRLYRPAQDTSGGYGSGVTINRVDRLTPTEYEETVVATVSPDREGRYRGGIHTLSAAGDVTLVDGRRDVFVWAAFKTELRARMGRFGRTGR